MYNELIESPSTISEISNPSNEDKFNEESYRINNIKKDIYRYLKIIPNSYKIEVIQYLKDNFNLKESNEQFGEDNTILELEVIVEILGNLMNWTYGLQKVFESTEKDKLLDLKSTHLAAMKIELHIEDNKESKKRIEQKIKNDLTALRLIKLIHNITIKEQKKAKENKG